MMSTPRRVRATTGCTLSLSRKQANNTAECLKRSCIRADVALAEAAAILRELTPAEPAALGLATASTISSSGKAAYQIDSPSTTTTAGMPEGTPYSAQR